MPDALEAVLKEIMRLDDSLAEEVEGFRKEVDRLSRKIDDMVDRVVRAEAFQAVLLPDLDVLHYDISGCNEGIRFCKERIALLETKTQYLKK